MTDPRLVEDTPEVVVDVAVVRRNVARMATAASAAGVALRPHVKTHKTVEVLALQRAAGCGGMLVAKVGEAEALADAGVTDVLVGYPVVGPAKLERLARLASTARVSVSFDAPEVAEGLSTTAVRHGVTFGARVEVDTGNGRVGVAPEAAARLAEHVARLPGLELDGVMTHEGQAYGARDEDELRARSHEACDRLVEAAEGVRARGLPCAAVSVGASATARFTIGRPGITEVRPGTYVFNDLTQLAHGAATTDDLALTVVATVVSTPAPGVAVVDAGSKTLTSDRLIRPDAPVSYGAVVGIPGAFVARLSEEHGMLALPTGTAVAIGDRVAIVPNHVCPVVNLADSLLAVDGASTTRWTVAARGRVR